MSVALCTHRCTVGEATSPAKLRSLNRTYSGFCLRSKRVSVTRCDNRHRPSWRDAHLRCHQHLIFKGLRPFRWELRLVASGSWISAAGSWILNSLLCSTGPPVLPVGVGGLKVGRPCRKQDGCWAGDRRLCVAQCGVVVRGGGAQLPWDFGPTVILVQARAKPCRPEGSNSQVFGRAGNRYPKFFKRQLMRT